MAEWLVIVLKAPFASFADSPGNAARPSAAMPTRSALIGLAGAVLGIERTDSRGQAALAGALVTATALHEPGQPLADFHTFQTLHRSAGGARTRADALANRDYLETAITRRGYRTDALWQAAYRLSERPDIFTLTDLAEAFRHPRFAPYVGRRSCPPAHPFNPLILDHEDVRDAFAEHGQRTGVLKARQAREFSLEDRGDAPGANWTSQHLRRDDPRDRSIRWTFGERNEWRLGQKDRPEERT